MGPSVDRSNAAPIFIVGPESNRIDRDAKTHRHARPHTTHVTHPLHCRPILCPDSEAKPDTNAPGGRQHEPLRGPCQQDDEGQGQEGGQGPPGPLLLLLLPPHRACCCDGGVRRRLLLPACPVFWWGEGSRRGQSSMGTASTDPTRTGAYSPHSRLCKDCILASQGSIDSSGTQPRRPAKPLSTHYLGSIMHQQSSVAAVRANLCRNPCVRRRSICIYVGWMDR